MLRWLLTPWYDRKEPKEPVSGGYHKNPVVGAGDIAGKREDMSLIPRNHIKTECCDGCLESPYWSGRFEAQSSLFVDFSASERPCLRQSKQVRKGGQCLRNNI